MTEGELAMTDAEKVLLAIQRTIERMENLPAAGAFALGVLLEELREIIEAERDA